MKKTLFILVVLMQTTLFAQVQTFEKPLKFTGITQGSDTDDILVLTPNKEVKKVSSNTFKTITRQLIYQDLKGYLPLLSFSQGVVSNRTGDMYGVKPKGFGSGLSILHSPISTLDVLKGSESLITFKSHTDGLLNNAVTHVTDASQLLFVEEQYGDNSKVIGLRFRTGRDDIWSQWYSFLHSGNVDKYALPITGGTVTGTIAAKPAVLATELVVKAQLDSVAVLKADISDLTLKVDKVTGSGLITDAEKLRLSTVVNYTHPATHPASIIAQDANNRFTTDAEKTVWNAKANASDLFNYLPLTGGALSGTLLMNKQASDVIQQGPSIYFTGGGYSHTQIQQGVGRFIFFRFNGSGWIEALTIRNSDGNIGIGTTTPMAKLEVGGSLKTAGTVQHTVLTNATGDATFTNQIVAKADGTLGTQPINSVITGSYSPTVTILYGLNLSSVINVNAHYTKTGNRVVVYCRFSGLVPSGNNSPDPSFRFALPFVRTNLANPTPYLYFGNGVAYSFTNPGQINPLYCRSKSIYDVEVRVPLPAGDLITRDGNFTFEYDTTE